MNYYRHNVGDYRRDTAHLSLLEHGIYRQLLDTYYLDEKPICLDLDRIMRSHCVRTADEEQALKNVLKDFFEVTEFGYVHKRCEEELQVIYAKSDKARQSAKARWAKENKGLGNSEEGEVMRSHSDRNADGMLPNTQYPILKAKETTSLVGSKLPTCSANEILDLFADKLPELPQPRTCEGGRWKKFKSRWNWVLTTKKRDGSAYATDKESALDFFGRFFGYVSGCDFLMGKTGWHGCSFDWLMTEANFLKVIEGNYQNKEAA